MFIEFIWIESFGIIKNQGFNFNPNVYYSYDVHTGMLDRKINNVIPPNFFNISNDTIYCITAMVGANGTGKSTLLSYIAHFLSTFWPKNGFIITSQEIINKSDRPVIFSSSWGKDKLPILNRRDLINHLLLKNGKSPLGKQASDRHHPQGLKILDNLYTDTRIIFYKGEMDVDQSERVNQSIMSLPDDFENSFYSDISDITMLSNDQRRYRTDKAVYSGENPLYAYRSGESQRFVEFMLGKYRKLIPFSMENLSVTLRINDIEKTFFDTYDQMAFLPIANILTLLIKTDKYSKHEKILPFLNAIGAYGLGDYFTNKLSKAEGKDKVDKFQLYLLHHVLLRHIREQLLQTMGELPLKTKLRFFILLLEDIHNTFGSTEDYITQINQYFKTTTFASEHTGKLNLKAVNAFYKTLSTLKLWEGEQCQMRLSDFNNITKVLKALNKLDESSGLHYRLFTIFDLDLRGLSTGEKQFLKIFSRFISYQLNNTNKLIKETSFIILLDEFDVGFHPLWQRKFLKTWINFLENFINEGRGHKIKVQLILTSHSPFVVSDLPKSCINFISKHGGNNYSTVDHLTGHHATFGANIHELYADSFFLDGALMGEFAKDKIDKILLALNDKKPLAKPEELLSTINMIGEPILRIKLAEMFAEKTGANTELARLDAQQAYIDQRRKEIQGQ